MDGAANVQTYRWNNNQREIAVGGTIALSRAAVKLRVRLAPPTNIRGNAGENFTVVGNPQIAMVNGVNTLVCFRLLCLSLVATTSTMVRPIFKIWESAVLEVPNSLSRSHSLLHLSQRMGQRCEQ